MTQVVIVESPAKARTLTGILGRGYRVVASLGHVRDLPAKELGVDVEQGFRPRYVTARGKQKTIQKLREAAQGAETVYLATDPDREGEAIAWHVVQVLKLPRGVPVRRVAFHAITPGAVQEAMRAPGQIDERLVEAQQTRRILDRLVGYQVSPLLWRRVRGGRPPRKGRSGGLSAGRVQTAALRLVVDREREIERFVPEEYWTLHARLAQQIEGAVPFLAELWRIAGKKPELKTEADVQRIVDELTPPEGPEALWWVESSETARKHRRPDPPFTTSTMQQAAARSLHYPPGLTMRLAQQLYEGIKLGEEGTVGLITYMRTDSTAVAPEAQAAAREVIERFWGAEFLPARPPVYQTHVKGAQEAHEAIRPTDPHRTPKAMREFLDEKQAALYELIWRRFIASQMADALYDVTTVLIPTARGERSNRLPYLFRAVGRVLVFAGFLKVYEEGRDPGEEGAPGGPGEAEGALPALRAGEGLDLLELIPKQHWTEPPSRFTEASLIKELERRGIGRPSTFASMVELIQERGYVVKEQRFLKPAPLGFAVCDLLVDFFPELFDYGFTAQMERTLDEIAAGRAQRLATLEAFWTGLEPALEKAGAEMPRVTVEAAAPGEGSGAAKGKGKQGGGAGGSGRTRGRKGGAAVEPTGRTCPECGGELVKRTGKYGPFVGCGNFPKCRYIERNRPPG
ncbi:MAG TPA: type I DNA topoisomerase [Anaerolineae bacterium]|nr:type I DNA topoisomerase [Anaerolineae bacterium]